MPSPQFDREVAGKALAMGSMGAVRALEGQRFEACPYPGHRPSDWRSVAGGPVVCGVCHPPACEHELVSG